MCAMVPGHTYLHIPVFPMPVKAQVGEWKVEEYHPSLKQNASLAKSPTRTETTQTNTFVAALWSFVKILLLKV